MVPHSPSVKTRCQAASNGGICNGDSVMAVSASPRLPKAAVPLLQKTRGERDFMPKQARERHMGATTISAKKRSPPTGNTVRSHHTDRMFASCSEASNKPDEGE